MAGFPPSPGRGRRRRFRLVSVVENPYSCRSSRIPPATTSAPPPGWSPTGVRGWPIGGGRPDPDLRLISPRSAGLRKPTSSSAEGKQTHSRVQTGNQLGRASRATSVRPARSPVTERARLPRQLLEHVGPDVQDLTAARLVARRLDLLLDRQLRHVELVGVVRPCRSTRSPTCRLR